MDGLTVTTKLGTLHYADNGSLIAPTIVTGVLTKGTPDFSTGA